MKRRQRQYITILVAAAIVIGGIAIGTGLYRKNNKAIQTAAQLEGMTQQENSESELTSATAPTPIPTPTWTPAYTPTPLDVQTPGKADADITDRLIIKDGQRKAFLTFDDGPSENTAKILDILKQYQVKATFFVMGKNAECHPDLVKRIVEEGHALANHSYHHNYGYMYSSADNFKQEVLSTNELLVNIVGPEHVQKLFRFPGGSFEESKAPYRQLLHEMGYSYVDWNALNGDADGKKYTYDHIMSAFRDSATKHEDSIILMHDTAAKSLTVEALPECIEYLQCYGFTFEPIHVADGTEGAA